MFTTLFVLSLVLPVLAVFLGGFVERSRRKLAERELPFWDSNVLAAIHGGALQ